MPQTTRTFVLDGYTFPQADIPARGPMEPLPGQRWVRHTVVGTVQPGDILTFLGFESQSWDLVSRAITATKDKLVAVYNTQADVDFKTPEEPSGFDVLMINLNIQHQTPIDGGKFLCRFTLVRR